jgi:hypothetical protein
MLEINVFEQTYVVDTVGDAVAVLTRVVQQILSDNKDIPVNILISKPRANSPPALGINVSEVIEIKDKLV